MSKEALAKVVQRAISDGAFRRQLSSDPSAALRGFDLSADESAAIRSGDSGRLSALGVDLRMSKAFTLSGDGATGASVHSAVSNDLGASFTGAATTGGAGSAGSGALISGDTSDNDAMITAGDGAGRDAAVIPGGPAHALGAETGGDAAFNASLTGGDNSGTFGNVLTSGDDSTEGVIVIDEGGVSGASTPGEAADGPAIQE